MTEFSDLEALLASEQAFVSYQGEGWRVVESQEEAATLSVVDDIDEQRLLEDMLDAVKPNYREGTEHLHYLLRTAFRYPPLKWGSRFGTQAMPSYLYASEEVATALAECAYYRLLFVADMQTPSPAPIRSQLCVFSFAVATQFCLDLDSALFKQWYAQLTHPADYRLTQRLGRALQDNKQFELIRFASARAKTGVNLAIKEPRALAKAAPSSLQSWVCLIKPDSVSFSSRASRMSYVFSKTGFSDGNGNLYRVA